MSAPDTGSDRQVEAWVRRHQAAPWRFLRLCGCPSDVADDLAQEALLAALHKGVDAQPDAIAASWLRGAVTNLWRMHLRSARVRGDALATFAADLALAELAYSRCAREDDGEAWRAALLQCLERLDGGTREALRLRYEQDLSREELGRRLGLGVDGVKARLRRAREALRECVERRVAVSAGGPR
jgi:RNA polymerase sigma-70 factor (ECF subfamily)